MTKTRFYIIRHGETDWNAEERFIGWSDMPLSKRGEKQAACAGRAMKDVPIDKIYCSPLWRVRQTADYVRGGRDIEIIPKQNLIEMCLGDAEARMPDETAELYPQVMDDWVNHPENLKFPDHQTIELFKGNSMLDVQERCFPCIMEIYRENVGKNICIVTHNLVTQLFMSKLLNIPIADVWEIKHLENASITILDIWTNGEFEVVQWGEWSHLDPELSNEAVLIPAITRPGMVPKWDANVLQGKHYYEGFKTEEDPS